MTTRSHLLPSPEPDGEKWLTPPAIGRRLAVKASRVRRWIVTGQLRAANLGDGSRPRWRIDPADLEAFLARRSPSLAPSPIRRQRRKATAIVEYY
jgi:hypothetical protein